MSRFFSSKYAQLSPYVPGEQPQGMLYTKLNTNESPYPPSQRAAQLAAEYTRQLNLYPDPECAVLRAKLAQTYGVSADEVILGNGSDEVLNFAFMAFCDAETPAAFADVTYGFYPVFAALNGVPYEEIPLREDFGIDADDYCGIGKTIFIANPNAPTGLMLPRTEIERILRSNPNNVVVVDEAYVDFGGESSVPLVREYDNLLVVHTFSKSRSMAGARLGYGIANSALIQDMNTIRNSTNPYNINSMTIAMGMGVLEDADYTRANCARIAETREYTTRRLMELGFEVIPSKANFVFARTDRLCGRELYLKLKERGVLVRNFNKDRISDYNRITIGTVEQMDALLNALGAILEV